MTKRLISTAILVSITSITGCAGYDKWAEDTNRKVSAGYTELVMGKQSVEFSPSQPKGLELNIAYRLGEGKGLPGRGTSPFYNKITGDVTYAHDCKNRMSFDVAILNQDGALISTNPISVKSYDSGMKALIETDVITDPTKSYSSKVGKLVIKNFKCR